MRIGLTAVAVLLGTLGAAATASAQETSSTGSSEGFGRRAHNIVVLDDLFGYADPSFKAENDEGEDRSVDPFIHSGTGFFPMQVIQLGYHYALDNGLTLGSGIGFWYLKDSDEGDDDEGSSILHLEARPRIGYALPLSPMFAFWPRAGVGFFRRGFSAGDDDVSYWAMSADIDALMVLTPAPHFGITGGLKFSIPLAAGFSEGDLDGSYSMTSMTFGLLTDF